MSFFLKDHERCAFGLGWEYRRRGLQIDDAPEWIGSSDFLTGQFIAGFNSFQTSKSATYDAK